jgi:release factor glutamine methyltransferase
VDYNRELVLVRIHRVHIPTPEYSHLSAKDFDRVYEPSEDTFLLLDALENEQHFLEILRPLICVEIGCGSGVVSAFLTSLLKRKQIGHICVATDINEYAARMTKKTLERNKVEGDVVITDLLSNLSTRLAGQIDVLLFNPPYVETSSEEVGSLGLECAWAGGQKGREVMDRILPTVSELLSPVGVFYLVLVEQNEPSEVSDLLMSDGMYVKWILARRAGRERLMVLRCSKQYVSDDY